MCSPLLNDLMDIKKKVEPNVKIKMQVNLKTAAMDAKRFTAKEKGKGKLILCLQAGVGRSRRRTSSKRRPAGSSAGSASSSNIRRK